MRAAARAELAAGLPARWAADWQINLGGGLMSSYAGDLDGPPSAYNSGRIVLRRRARRLAPSCAGYRRRSRLSAAGRRVTLYCVGSVKETRVRTYVAVDGG
jgi:hypothetical protein